MNEELARALLAAQKEMPALARDSTNEEVGSRYLSLGKLVEQVYPVLHKHGLFVIQAPDVVDGKPALTTTIASVKADAWISATMLLMLSKQDPQGQGSAITYARRYALMGMLGLVADEDDDGNSTRGAVVMENITIKVRPLADADPAYEFDPGKDRLPTAPRGDGLLQAVGGMQQAIDPTVDWKALSSALVGALHGGRMRAELNASEWETFLLRWVNAVTRLRDTMTGDFPPLTDETVQDAFLWAFDARIDVPHVETA